MKIYLQFIELIAFHVVRMNSKSDILVKFSAQAQDINRTTMLSQCYFMMMDTKTCTFIKTLLSYLRITICFCLGFNSLFYLLYMRCLILLYPQAKKTTTWHDTRANWYIMRWTVLKKVSVEVRTRTYDVLHKKSFCELLI